MDGLKEERERGITIDVAHKEFFSPKYYWTIIDAPGHRDFVKNMITGASQADTAVLLCAANDGVNAQTKEHAFLARVLGVSELIVLINKMDISGVDWSQDKYEKSVEEMTNLLKMAGFGSKLADIPMIPGASLLGDNVYKKSENMSWYNGPTLFDAIDASAMPNKPLDKPLRLPIQDVYKIGGIGTVPVGKIETGILHSGKTVVFNPSQKSAEVKSIERCTIQWSTRLSLEITLVSTSVDSLQLTSAVVTLLDTLKVHQPSCVMTRLSSDRFNLWIFQRLFQ
jgi:elongation factor 1-alpha